MAHRYCSWRIATGLSCAQAKPPETAALARPASASMLLASTLMLRPWAEVPKMAAGLVRRGALAGRNTSGGCMGEELAVGWVAGALLVTALAPQPAAGQPGATGE